MRARIVASFLFAAFVGATGVEAQFPSMTPTLEFKQRHCSTDRMGPSESMLSGQHNDLSEASGVTRARSRFRVLWASLQTASGALLWLCR